MAKNFYQWLGEKIGGTLHKGWEILKAVTITFWSNVLPEDNRNTEQLDPKALRKAWREKLFIKTIIRIPNSFLLAGGGFSIPENQVEGESILAKVAEFWKQPAVSKTFKKGTHESLHMGNGFFAIKDGIIFGSEENKKNPGLVVIPQENIVIDVDPFLQRITKAVITYQLEEVKGTGKQKPGVYKMTITDETVKITKPGESPVEFDNPYGRPPIVHVAEQQMITDLYGEGILTRPLYNLLDDYEKVLSSAIRSQRYHGAPSPVITGGDNPAQVLADLGISSEGKNEKAWTPGKVLALAKDYNVSFLEAQNVGGIAPDLLNIIYWCIVVETGIPEWLFGVHMKAAQASTKIQLHNILSWNSERRDNYGEAIQELSMFLQTGSFNIKPESTVRPEIIWGSAELLELDELIKAVAELITLGLLSKETAMHKFPTIIVDVERELENLRKEQEEADKRNAPFLAALKGGKGQAQGDNKDQSDDSEDDSDSQEEK